MSMHPHPIPAIPEETARVARAILPQGNVYLQMRDELGTLYQDEDFRDLFPSRGQPAEVPWRLALVTLMQYAEGLTDRQEALAVRTRIDWKYVLSLELTDSGFDFSVLSGFRGRLLAHGAERRLFDRLLEQFRERGWRKRARQATHRLDACAGCYSHAAPAGMCRGNDASRTQRAFQRLLPPGSWSTWTPSGPSGMRNASVIFACPKRPRREWRWLKPLGLMGVGCWNTSTQRPTFPGWPNWKRSKRCGGCGFSTIMRASKARPGALMTNCLPQRC